MSDSNGVANGHGNVYEAPIEVAGDLRDASSGKSAEMPMKPNGVHVVPDVPSDSKIMEPVVTAENGDKIAAVEGGHGDESTGNSAAIDAPIEKPDQQAAQESIPLENGDVKEANKDGAHVNPDVSAVSGQNDHLHRDGSAPAQLPEPPHTDDKPASEGNQPIEKDDKQEDRPLQHDDKEANHLPQHDNVAAAAPPAEEQLGPDGASAPDEKPYFSTQTDSNGPAVELPADSEDRDHYAAAASTGSDQAGETAPVGAADAAPVKGVDETAVDAPEKAAADSQQPAGDATQSEPTSLPPAEAAEQPAAESQALGPETTSLAADSQLPIVDGAELASQPPAAETAQPAGSSEPAAPKAVAGLGLGLGLKLPARAMRPPYTGNLQEELQSAAPAKSSSVSSTVAPQADASQTSEAAQENDAPVAAGAAAAAVTPPNADTVPQTSSGNVASTGPVSTTAQQPAARPALPAKPSGLGSGLPLKAKPAVAKRAKSQVFAAAPKSTTDSAAAAIDADAERQAEEARVAAKQQAAALATAVQSLPIKHSTKTEELHYLSSLVLQELKHLQAYLRHHQSLSSSADELTALVQAGTALGLGQKLGHVQKYVGSSSTITVTQQVNLRSLLETADKSGHSKLQQQLELIIAESDAEEMTLGALLHALATKVPPSSIKPATQAADRAIEDVVADLDKAVEARAALEQQQVLRHIHSKDWCKSFSNQIEIPRRPSLLRKAVSFIFGLPLLPFKVVLGVIKPTEPAAGLVLDRERVETRRFEARLKLLRAYQQAVLDKTGIVAASSG